jgi:hypothetical protein
VLELPRIGPISTAATVCFVAILILTGRWLNTDSRERRPDTSSARTSTAGTQAPARIGTRTECPPRWPVLAASNHTTYRAIPAPPPPGETAVTCSPVIPVLETRRAIFEPS